MCSYRAFCNRSIYPPAPTQQPLIAAGYRSGVSLDGDLALSNHNRACYRLELWSEEQLTARTEGINHWLPACTFCWTVNLMTCIMASLWEINGDVRLSKQENAKEKSSKLAVCLPGTSTNRAVPLTMQAWSLMLRNLSLLTDMNKSTVITFA